MKNPKRVLSIIAAFALFGVTTLASAQAWGGCACAGSSSDIGYKHGAWLSKLNNFTKEQKGHFDRLHTEFMKKFEALRAQKAQKTIELAELATKSPQDEAAIQKEKEEIWGIQDRMINENRAFRTKVRAILTPEQREQLRTIFGFGLAAQISNLTKEQKEKISALKIDFLKKKLALKGEKGQKKIELMELFAKSPQDETAIQKKKGEIWALKDQIRKERRNFSTSVRSLLTPEQREKLGVWPVGCFGFHRHNQGMM